MTSILIADIGGTNGRFARLSDPSMTQLAPRDTVQLSCRNFNSFEALLHSALNELGIEIPTGFDAVFAIAGPVNGEQGEFTNLAWQVDARTLERVFGFASVHFLNDLVAAVHGLAHADRQFLDHESLQNGREMPGARQLLLNVGTGLGVAYWWKPSGSLHVDGSEAGHMGFSPANTEQTALLEHLHEKYGRVSWERVLSGTGLAALDAYLRGSEAGSPAAVVARAVEDDDTAHRAIDLFTEMLGTFAGDLVLGAPARGGVWMTGGVLDGLDQTFDMERFFHGFYTKGRMARLLHSVPVFRLREKGLGLKGAWEVALGNGKSSSVTSINEREP
ncbi:MAG: glucokinase [Pseudomonadales bacterium]